VSRCQKRRRKPNGRRLTRNRGNRRDFLKFALRDRPQVECERGEHVTARADDESVGLVELEPDKHMRERRLPRKKTAAEIEEKQRVAGRDADEPEM
jgi:hypothetical protein